MLLEATLKRLHLYDILEKGQKINQRLPGNGAGKEFVSKGAQGNLGTVEKIVPYFNYGIGYTIVCVCQKCSQQSIDFTLSKIFTQCD